MDILALDFVNKPQPGAYYRALEILGDPSPKDCVFVDDRIENLHPAKDLGMTTVLVEEETNGSMDLPTHDEIIRIEKIETLLTVLPELRR